MLIQISEQWRQWSGAPIRLRPLIRAARMDCDDRYGGVWGEVHHGHVMRVDPVGDALGLPQAGHASFLPTGECRPRCTAFTAPRRAAQYVRAVTAGALIDDLHADAGASGAIWSTSAEYPVQQQGHGPPHCAGTIVGAKNVPCTQTMLPVSWLLRAAHQTTPEGDCRLQATWCERHRSPLQSQPSRSVPERRRPSPLVATFGPFNALGGDVLSLVARGAALVIPCRGPVLIHWRNSHVSPR